MPNPVAGRRDVGSALGVIPHSEGSNALAYSYAKERIRIKEEFQWIT